MAEIGYSITANLIDVLARDVIQNICRLWNYQSQLDKLMETVSTIQQVFLDADAKRDQLNNQDRNFIGKLKDVVYDAEDVFDEFRTRAELSQLGKKSKVRKFFGKVRGIFSLDKVYHAHRVSRDVMEIKEKLDAIATNHKLFELKIDNKAIVRRSRETCSYMDVGKIIGRDKDKELIMNMLLDPNVQEVTIVGIGGLGKTALAQLVYNDESIKQKFFHKLWVCVSDQEGAEFNVKVILCKIIALITRGEFNGNSCSFELVQNLFQDIIKGQMYFLVLDDVWNEDRVKWEELKKFLSMGQDGSKIIVTSRSEQTAKTIGNKHVYRLDGLSQKDSQCLFEMSAFGEGERNYEFVEIGKNIVGKCHRNPLALKVMGSLLFDQPLSKWQSFERMSLTNISKGSDDDKIMYILKLSYHKLTPSLKSCFTYCAIFPKDFDMDKDMLIGLWMSQGYIVPFDEGQSVEDAAEEYFLILMRCFFQDVKKDEYDNVKSVKIHDLMHDVAQEVGKDEIHVLTSKKSTLEKKIRHVRVVEDICAKTLLSGSKIRSYICKGTENVEVTHVENVTTLRVLELSYSSLSKSLVCSIDRLILLRYLNLWSDNLETIPNSITRLYNLKTFVLRCGKLRELPIDFSNLVNLRHLDVSECYQLNSMPIGMDKLTKLRVLPRFVAGGNSDNELKVLQFLTEIKGHLNMSVQYNYRNMDGVNDKGGGYLKSMKHLTHLTIHFSMISECEVVLKNLEPHVNLKGLNMYFYNGTTIPWSAFSPQHNFVYICIESCPNLKRVAALSRLSHLKSLTLRRLDNVEYIEDEMNNNSSNDKNAVAVFFPSLEYLEIMNLGKLKGWWKEELPKTRIRFPSLSFLQIRDCPNLVSFALCSNPQYQPVHELPNLCTLRLWGCSRWASNLICLTLKCVYMTELGENLLITCENSQGDVVKLGELTIDKAVHLNSLTTDCLTHLIINFDSEWKSVLEVEEAFQRCASTLRTLCIRLCHNLSTLSGLEHLPALEDLILSDNNELNIYEEDEEPWKSLHQTLCKLKFSSLPQMKSLPIGMRHLTSLQSLQLLHCHNVEGELPEWMSCLSSLQYLRIEDCQGIKSFPEAMKDLTSLKMLDIWDCPSLQKRCKKPHGEDFPKIQNIPKINIVLWVRLPYLCQENCDHLVPLYRSVANLYRKFLRLTSKLLLLKRCSHSAVTFTCLVFLDFAKLVDVKT